MLEINGLEQGLPVFRALGSEARMKIIHLLIQNRSMNLNELATSLGLTNGALTAHIRKLEECGMIKVEIRHSGRGLQKVCSLAQEQILLNILPSMEDRDLKMYETQIRVGHYSDYNFQAGCGLAGKDGLIGPENEPRSFSFPDRLEAELLWFHEGYIEYRIPNLLPENQKIVQLTLSFEIGSAQVGSEDDPRSEICFFLNGQKLGRWLSFCSDGRGRGLYTPQWWIRAQMQYGFLKMLVINQAGVFLDGVKLVDGVDGKVLPDTSGEMKLRFEVHNQNGHNGGFALFGENFGNYKQGIHARIHYMPEEILNG